MGYRVIIADDEKKIIQLIKQLGHWDQLGIEIIDECHDGKEALESIIQNKPDIVISDIKMPELDGIQLIEIVRRHNLNSLFILLSGYRHFEYARNAIQLNVVDYLLKPIDEKQLNETLEKACKQLEQMLKQKENAKKIEQYEAAEEQTRLADFWKIILQRDREKADRVFVSETVCNANFPTDFIYNSYQVIYVNTNLYGMLTLDNTLFSEKIGNYINNSFNKLTHVIYFTDFIGNIIILNFDKVHKAEIKNLILTLFYNIRDLNEIYGDFRLNIGCSRIKSSCTELINAFEEAFVAEWGRLVFFGNKIIEYEQIISLQRFEPSMIINKSEEKMIQDGVAYLRTKELGEAFANIHNKLAAFNNANPQDMAATFMHLRDITLSCIQNSEQKERMYLDYYYAYQDAKNFQQIFKEIYLRIEKYIVEEQKKLKEKMIKPIETAVRYMKQSYSKQISLEEVARISNVSPSYLSKLFKEEMKIGFSEYLTHIRLEESKRMLSDSNFSVKEIALRIGYYDEKYYSKLFKKLIGIKPTDYRKLYG